MDTQTPSATPWRSRSYSPLRKFLTIIAGLRFAVLNDFSVLYKVLLSLGILGITVYLRHWVDLIIILVVTTLMICAELFNTAIEALCDFVQPASDPRIAQVKDVAAAATGITIVLWSIVLGYEYTAALRRLLD